MWSFRVRLGLLFAAGALMVIVRSGYAQAEAPLSPEPGDNAAAEKTISALPEAAPEESTAKLSQDTSSTAKVEGSSIEAPREKRIDQRVDGTSSQDIIRVAPRPKKNVYRIDNLPNRPKVTPIAVISGPVAPWGYATRYINGEVDRPSAKDLQGTGAQSGGRNSGGRNSSSTGSGTGGRSRSGSARKFDD